MQLKISPRNLDDATRKVAQLVRKVGDLRPVLAQFGIHMIRSVEQTFEAGGRPTAWPPSLRVLLKGGKTLIDTARLKNSVVAAVTGPTTMAIGTNVAYAAAHQLGFTGVVQIPAHVRFVRTRDRIMYEETHSTRTGKAYVKRSKFASGFTTVRAHPAHLRIPRRPFLVVQESDRAAFYELLARHLEATP
jgi:phage gpG-like protein